MSSEHLINLTGESFEQETAQGTALVDFWAPWCGPCRMVGPVIDELAGEYAGKAKICKLNVDENGQLAANFGVMSIPTILILKDGKEAERIVGARPKAELAKVLDKYLEPQETQPV